MVNDSTVKENLFRIRERMGLSQEEMGQRLGISRTSYRKLEKGETVIVHGVVTSVSELAGISEEEVLLGYDPAGIRDSTLQSGIDWEERMRTLRLDYEERLSQKDSELIAKSEIIKTQADLIKSQKSMIAYLEKRIPEE